MESRVLTFIVTKDCQLRCRYCYLVGKKSDGKMNLTTAKKAVDIVFSSEYFRHTDKLIFDFIGGEPLLAIDLIEETMTYLIKTMHELYPEKLNNYGIRITTNGILYSSEKVQRFIETYKSKLDISISIDGGKIKNDINRIFPDGKGSYDVIRPNVQLWISQFPNVGTKMTISHDDLYTVCESLIHLIDLGITNIDVNPVLENVWEAGDEFIFEEQLIRFADYIIDNRIWNRLNISVFDEDIGNPIENKYVNPCGSMNLSIDGEGNLFPCLRFAKFSLREKAARSVGNIREGIDYNRLRAFETLNNETSFPDICKKCEIASGCKWCPAEAYDCSKTGSIFDKPLHACRMHHAKVKAKNYYYNKLSRIIE